jgi:DNA-binding response OmpR family regulator
MMAGMDDYLSKPLDADLLAAALERAATRDSDTGSPDTGLRRLLSQTS